jgi:hypothetical protein
MKNAFCFEGKSIKISIFLFNLFILHLKGEIYLNKTNKKLDHLFIPIPLQ